MAPTAIFHFFEKSSGRFFNLGHFCNYINVQNLRGPSEFSGKTYENLSCGCLDYHLYKSSSSSES